MSLETAATIDLLVATNPLDTDPISQGGGHLRLIKAALKGTFTGLVGTTAVTKAALDWLLANYAAVTTLLTAAIVGNSATTQYVTGAFNAGTTINATTQILQGGNPLVPRGVVVAWWGQISTIPAGWLFCDGTNGTPDLRGYFMGGVGTGGTVGLTGGASTATATTSSAGSHTHGGNTGSAGGHTPTGSTDVQGSHNHSGFTGAGYPGGYGGIGFASGSAQHENTISSDGVHQHTLSINAVGPHIHSISADGVHTHSVTVATVPPYVQMAFIMKS
jgi:hypothetical protein